MTEKPELLMHKWEANGNEYGASSSLRHNQRFLFGSTAVERHVCIQKRWRMDMNDDVMI